MQADNFSLMFAFAYADGQDELADQPIDSIEPINGVVGLRYDAPNELWSTELTGWPCKAASKPRM